MIIVSTVTETFCACPNTYSGKTTNGDTIFVRYRWGHLSIRLQPGKTVDDSEGSNGESIFELDYGGPFDGMINYSKLRELTEKIIQWPNECHEKSVSPIETETSEDSEPVSENPTDIREMFR
jgi:hypothetical protein